VLASVKDGESGARVEREVCVDRTETRRGRIAHAEVEGVVVVRALADRDGDVLANVEAAIGGDGADRVLALFLRDLADEAGLGAGDLGGDLEALSRPLAVAASPLPVAASLDGASEGKCELRPPEETGKAGARLRKDRGSPAFHASAFGTAPIPTLAEGVLWASG
jgi:hypothetical protein